MNFNWSKKKDKKGLKELINIMFVLYVYYIHHRGRNLAIVEYFRNLAPMVKSGIITEETLNFVSFDIQQIEKMVHVKEEESILNKKRKKEKVKQLKLF